MRSGIHPPTVVVVALCAGASADALLDVRATTLPVVGSVTDTHRHYLLDEIPGDAIHLARWLRAQPWCARAEALASDGDALAVVRVLDPALGTLVYGVRPVGRDG